MIRHLTTGSEAAIVSLSD